MAERLYLIDPQTGVVNTGLSDGSQPLQFANVIDAQNYMQAHGEKPTQVNSAEQAFNVVRGQTGVTDYAGYTGPDYRPPVALPGSPAYVAAHPYTAPPPPSGAPQPPAPPTPPVGGAPARITFRKNGITRMIAATDAAGIGAALRARWIPLDKSGKAYQVVNYLGGYMLKDPTSGSWGPVNQLLQGEAMTPEQTAALPGFTTANTVQWPTDEAGELTLRGPDGKEEKTIKAGQWQQIDQLIKNGWLPLNQAGKPYGVHQYMGGDIFFDPDRPGQAFPLNVLLGGKLTPEQEAAMPGGWQWDPRSIDNPDWTSGGEGSNAGGGSWGLGDYGSLLQGFNLPFNYPDLPLSSVASPYPEFKFNPQDIARDPSYQFRYKTGLEAVDRLLSSKGQLYGATAGKELTAYGQDFASQEWQHAYDRALQDYLTGFDVTRSNQNQLAQQYQAGFGRAMGQYGNQFDIFNTNQNNAYNRLAGISGSGQTAGYTAGQLGSNFAGLNSGTMQNNATSLANLWGGAANARAAGRVGSSNAWQNAFGNTAQSIASIYSNRRWA